MFWSVFAPKGGAGTSVCAAALALELAAEATLDRPVLLVDFGGDQGEILGVDVGDTPGVVDWCESGDAVGREALDNLVVDVVPGLQLLPRGSASLPARSGIIDPARCVALIEHLGARAGFVVADIGVPDLDPASPRALLLAASDRSTCVVRDCYLSLRRLTQMPVVVDEVIELVEPGRALSTVDVEAVVGRPVAARLRVDPLIARSVDAGLLTQRRPRPLRRAIRDLLADDRIVYSTGARR